MHTDTDPTNKKRPNSMTEPPEDPLFASIADAFEADVRAVERLKARARSEIRQVRRAPGFSEGWVFRMALASALTFLIAIGVWRFPSTQNPPPTIQTPGVVEKGVDETGAVDIGGALVDESSADLESAPTLTISNESGFVTVKAGGSQWIVLPGDKS